MMIFDLDPTLFTLSMIVITSFFILFIDDRVILSFVNNSDKPYFKKNLTDNSYFLILFFILFVLTTGYQGQYLNYETIDSDIHTYLLVGNDVLNGYLPYENEWDDKGPMLYIFYAILIFLSNNNLIIFKILCNVIVLIISFTIAKISFLIITIYWDVVL